MNAPTSRASASPWSAKRSFSFAAIAASSPLAISRITAAPVGLSVYTFSERVSNSTPPNFSSRNLT
jgi:hypothetical protein